MSYEAIGRRYAQAIFEIGKESNALTQVGRDLGDFAEMYSHSAELRAALSNPLVPDTARSAILDDLLQRMGVSDVAKNSLRLVARKRRLAALPGIARQLGRLVDEETKVVRAKVTSAGPLSEAYLARLRIELERTTGKKVIIAHEVDASLLGGVITQLGDRVIDGSVRSRLMQFKDGVLQGASG